MIIIFASIGNYVGPRQYMVRNIQQLTQYIAHHTNIITLRN